MIETLRRPLFTVAAIAFTMYMAIVIGQSGSTAITFQDVIVFMVAGTAIVLFFAGEHGIHVAFIIWTFLFILGYRRADIAGFQLHPLTLIMYGLAVYIPIRRVVTNQTALSDTPDKKIQIPILAVISIPFWLYGWVAGLQNGYAWQLMLNEFLNIGLLIPLIFVAQYVLKRRPDYLKPAIIGFYLAECVVAFFGIIGYWFPGFGTFIPGLVVEDVAQIAGSDGFTRANFLFYGSAVGALLLCLSIPFAYTLWTSYKARPQRLLVLFGLGLQLYGVYIAGYRSLWVIVAGLIGLLVIKIMGLRAVPLVVALALLVVVIAPSATIARFESLISAVQGDIVDSSAQKRTDRINTAIEAVVQYPQGGGWGTSGWVFNDFLQLALSISVLGCGVLRALVCRDRI